MGNGYVSERSRGGPARTTAGVPREAMRFLLVGGTAVWLCSDYGNCTSGEIVHVDCGYHVLGMPQQDNL